MADETVDLRSEERRRQVTLTILGGLLLATTLPVVNQRALFSPLGDVPILGDLSPVAYAVTFGTPVGSMPVLGGAGGPEEPARAFALRAPGDPAGSSGAGSPSAGTPPGAGSTSAPPAALSPSALPPVAGPAGAPPAGGGVPGGGGGVPGSGGGSTPPQPPGPIGAVPEPATWFTMILGFAIVGSIMRRARRRDAERPEAVSAG